MPFPILACYELGVEKGIMRVRRNRERPRLVEVGAEAHDQNPIALLGRTEVGRVETLEYDVVEEALLRAARLMPRTSIATSQPGCTARIGASVVWTGR